MRERDDPVTLAAPAPAAGPPAAPGDPAAPEADRRGLDTVIRVGGAVVGVLGGLLTALIEAFLSPLRVAEVRFPLSVLLAAVGNVALIWFTYRTTRHRGLALLPGAVWFAVMVAAAGRTTEGDILLPANNWVGLVTIFAGTLGFGIGGYRMILAHPVGPARAAPTAPPDPPRPR